MRSVALIALSIYPQLCRRAGAAAAGPAAVSATGTAAGGEAGASHSGAGNGTVHAGAASAVRLASGLHTWHAADRSGSRRPLFPGAQFLNSYDAGRGQRFCLFGYGRLVRRIWRPSIARC